MKATLTSQGQIAIPIAIREKLGLKPGDQIEFDENATILVGRRVVNLAEWSEAPIHRLLDSSDGDSAVRAACH